MAYRVKVAEQRVLKSAANQLVEIQFSTVEIHWELFVKNDHLSLSRVFPKTENFSDIVWDYGAYMFQTNMLQTSNGDRPVICDRSPVRVTSGLMVQHLRCRWKVGCDFLQKTRVERSEKGLEMLQGLLILQMFPPKHMIFLVCSVELAFVQHP